MGNVVNLNVLAVELGCRMGHLPSTCLGLPLGASHKSEAVWDNIEERARRDLPYGRGITFPKGAK